MKKQQTSAQASNMRIKKLMQAPTSPTLKRTITYVEEEEIPTAPKKRATSSGLEGNDLNPGMDELVHVLHKRQHPIQEVAAQPQRARRQHHTHKELKWQKRRKGRMRIVFKKRKRTMNRWPSMIDK